MPRFLSLTFVIGFGLGAIVGVSMALLALAVATEPEADESAVTASPTVAASVTPAPSASPTPTTGPSTTASMQVRFGPDEEYATIGTIARRTEVSIAGRDGDGAWLAIHFPPGSTAWGWVRAEAVTNLSAGELTRYAVVGPTPLPSTPVAPAAQPVVQTTRVASGGIDATVEATEAPRFATPRSGGGFGDDGPGDLDPTPIPTRTATPEPSTPERSTPEPAPTEVVAAVGPADLAFAGFATTSGGEVRVSVSNNGPGAVPAGALSVSVSAGAAGSETLTYSRSLEPGDTVTLRSSLRLTEEALVTAIIDPSGRLSDTNRANNRLSHPVAP